MISRVFIGMTACLLSGCMSTGPSLSRFAEQRFGYAQEESFAAEPFAKLMPSGPSAAPSLEALPAPAFNSAQQPAAPRDAAPVRDAALPVYDETKDPHVMAVLLPDVSQAALDKAYQRRADGSVHLPPPAHIPVIETQSVRKALASGLD